VYGNIKFRLQTVILCRNVKRFREMLGIKQEVLALDLFVFKRSVSPVPYLKFSSYTFKFFYKGTDFLENTLFLG